MKQLIIAALIAVSVASCGNVAERPQGELKSEVYIVQSGDTLDEISYRYMQKSSVRRDIREFREDIIELNWDTVFKDRYPHGLIHPGDHLQINYYVEK